MDHYSLESEVIETLDFLSPPVLRNRKVDESWSLFDYFPGYADNSDGRLLNRFGNRRPIDTNVGKVITDHSSSVRCGYGSSTSLFLKKTQENEIVQQSTESSERRFQFTKQSEDPSGPNKPTIKVTVIPNSKQKSKNRKKRTPRKVESSVSNQENSIKAENVFLVVSGRKKEKVYEVKTTGSAEFPDTPRGRKNEIAVGHLKDIKLLMNSLNMDKKKKKGKNKETSIPPSAPIDNRFVVNNVGDDLATEKSGVRISGKVCLAGDDRYIVNCAATINNKPISTKMIGLNNDTITFTNAQDTYYRRELKDSYVQTQMDGFETEVNFNMRKGSQYEATNMKPLCFSNIDTLKIFANKDQQIQCFCPQNMQDVANNICNYSELDPSKSPTPLVIISVYQKQGPSDNKNEESQNDNETRGRSLTKDDSLRNERKAKIEKNTVKKNISKSPSPVKSPVSKKSRSTIKPVSPANSIRISKQKESKPSPKVDKDTVKSNTEKKPNKKEQPKMKVEQTARIKDIKGNQGLSKNGAKSMGTNADYVSTKKALVDTYMKQLNDKVKYNERTRGNDNDAPKYGISNVKVNIESEHEKYDFLYRQGEMMTDLRVRKTLKDQSSQKNYDIDDPSLSMENFFLTDDHQDTSCRRRSFSQTFLFPNQPLPSFDEGLQKFNPFKSRLNVRDSIELSHRRDESRKMSQIFNRNPSMQQEPSKHFPGDSCSIIDPTERDREIRTLLGVNVRPSRSRPAVEDLSTTSDEIFVQYLYDVNDRNIRNYSVPIKPFEPSCSKEMIVPNAIRLDAILNTPKQLSTPKTLDNSPQQLIKLNRNINVYMQLEKNMHPPIVLTHKQYIKLKRTIDHSCVKRPRICNVYKKESFLYGNSKKKMSEPMFRYNKSTQTEKTKGNILKNVTKTEMGKLLNEDKVYASVQKDSVWNRLEKYNPGDFNNLLTAAPQNRFGVPAASAVCHGQKTEILPKLLYSKDSKIRKRFEQANKNTINIETPTNSKCLGDFKFDKKPSIQKDKEHCVNDARVQKRDSYPKCNEIGLRNDYNFFIDGNRNSNASKANGSKHVASSVEIRYTSYAYSMKQVTFSTDKVGGYPKPPALLNHRDLSRRNSDNKKPHRTDSILTLFKGHKRAPTPNLGTSLYSLDSNDSDVICGSPFETRQRKPFLKRLMSCLVMRSKISEIKLGKGVPMDSANSSVDSYHISTSLGAIEISSSLYDTSASFFSNHTIMPVNSKIKRGFFNSVRGFLSNRKS